MAAGWLRLAGALLVLAAGVLVIVPAPTNRLWFASVGLTELGHWFAPVALLPLWPGWHRTRAGRASAACGVAAAACFLTPLLRALPVAQTLPDHLDAAFGRVASVPRSAPDATPRARPLDALTLFTGVRSQRIEPARISYSRRGGQELSLDLYARERSAYSPPAPIVVLLHGGGWQTGTPVNLSELAQYLAARGYVVAAPEYRLAPAHPFPAAFDDVTAAIALLRGRASAWNADADGLVLIGRSAGAQLALLAAYSEGVAAVRGVVAFYGPSDLRFAWEHPGNPLVYDGTGVLERYLGGTPSEAADRYRDASPYFLVSGSTPPTLLIHGRKDEIVWIEHSRRLAAKLAEAGRPHLLLELPWATHGCDFAILGPCGQLSVFAIERFLAAVTSH
jgi:acetyl esterase/lipase